MSNLEEIHDRVLNATDQEELASVYSEWAENYDKDLVDEMGFLRARIDPYRRINLVFSIDKYCFSWSDPSGTTVPQALELAAIIYS